MTLLDRLLDHDNTITQRLLTQCESLDANQWELPFLLGHMTLHETFDHMLRNVEVWTDLMMKRDVREAKRISPTSSPSLTDRWNSTYNEFAQFAREIERSDRIDELYCDTLDNPPREKSFGGTILHVISHNMSHRAEVMHMMRRLGIEEIAPTDMLTWEQSLKTAL